VCGWRAGFSLLEDRLARLVDMLPLRPQTMPAAPLPLSLRIARITTNYYTNWCFRMIVLAVEVFVAFSGCVSSDRSE
jgi:hypothetical protein